VIGYLRRDNRPWETALLFVAAVALILPITLAGVVGAACLVAVVLLQSRVGKKVGETTSL
jgi:TRAP-type uncharacterized transport system fused permease subunit